MKIMIYDYLPDEAKQIRERVFVEEQGFHNEIDEIDNVAEHFVVYMDDDAPAATCRVFWDAVAKSHVLGRFAVYQEYRGKKTGSAMMREAEKHVRETGGKSIILHAQCQVSGFYRKLGYVEYGEIEEIEGCPHVWMKKDLPAMEEEPLQEGDPEDVIKMLDSMTEAGVSRIKIETSEDVGEGRSQKAYHHGRCDVGSPFATGKLFDLEE